MNTYIKLLYKGNKKKLYGDTNACEIGSVGELLSI